MIGGIISFIVIILLGLVAVPLYNLDFFKTLHLIEKDCKLITTTTEKDAFVIKGAEDIAHDHDKKVLIIASQDRDWLSDVFMSGWDDHLKNRASSSSSSHDTIEKRGNIFILYYENDEIRKMKLNNFGVDGEQLDFNPHGISLLPQTDSNPPRLFVVNHRSDKDYVDIFDVDYADASLHYFTSLSHPTIRNANDVAALDGDSFFVTNMVSQRFGRVESQIRLLAEMGGLLSGGSLLFCTLSDQQCQVVADGFYASNGVILSDDKKSLFLIETSKYRLLKYHVSTSTTTAIPSLTLVNQYSISSQGDNLSFDTNGNLYVGCHPQAYRFMIHTFDKDKPSPSQVSVLKRGSDRVEDVFISNGSDLSGSSVAVPDNRGNFYVGAVYAKGILKCKL